MVKKVGNLLTERRLAPLEEAVDRGSSLVCAVNIRFIILFFNDFTMDGDGRERDKGGGEREVRRERKQKILVEENAFNSYSLNRVGAKFKFVNSCW